MSRKPRPMAFGPRDLYAAMKATGAPCRQKTQECLHTGDCALCNAATGEECRAARFEAQS